MKCFVNVFQLPSLVSSAYQPYGWICEMRERDLLSLTHSLTRWASKTRPFPPFETSLVEWKPVESAEAQTPARERTHPEHGIARISHDCVSAANMRSSENSTPGYMTDESARIVFVVCCVFRHVDESLREFTQNFSHSSPLEALSRRTKSVMRLASVQSSSETSIWIFLRKLKLRRMMQ